MGVLGKLVQMGTDINDGLIYNYLLENAKKNAKAYLTAALVSTAPDLRAYFTEQLNRTLDFHSALVKLGADKGWQRPDSPPHEMLLKEVGNAEALLRHKNPDYENT